MANRYTIQGRDSRLLQLGILTSSDPVGETNEFVAFHISDYLHMEDRMEMHVMSGHPRTANVCTYLDRNKLPLDWQQCQDLLVVVIKDGLTVLAQDLDKTLAVVTRVKWVDAQAKTQIVANVPLEFGLGVVNGNIVMIGGALTPAVKQVVPFISEMMVKTQLGTSHITPMYQWA